MATIRFTLTRKALVDLRDDRCIFRQNDQNYEIILDSDLDAYDIINIFEGNDEDAKIDDIEEEETDEDKLDEP